MFKCDKCEYETKYNGDLKRHIKTIHDKVKDFKCSKCNFVCSMNENLKRHIKTVHEKIKDIKCSKCKFMCSTNNILKLHIKQIHDKIKDIKCSKCEYVCSTKGHLTRHIKSVHNKIKDIKCSKCECVFSDLSNLKQHTKGVHDKIKDFKCSECEFICSASNSLKKHIQQVHERPITDKHMSLGEYAIYDYLTKNKVEFEREMKFQGLVSPKNKQLRYDFYIKSHNLLIEFDGAQHFKKVKWTITQTENDVNERFDYLVECDHLKNEYADANKIKMYRIKYTDIKNIDTILKVLLT